MSQYDETTKAKAVEAAAQKYGTEPFARLYSPNTVGIAQVAHASGYLAGRDSAKPSLEILARAVEEAGRMIGEGKDVARVWDRLLMAIAEVKARGDWPL